MKKSKGYEKSKDDHLGTYHKSASNYSDFRVRIYQYDHSEPKALLERFTKFGSSKTRTELGRLSLQEIGNLMELFNDTIIPLLINHIQETRR